MNDIERTRLETFNRVRSFGIAYAAHFPVGSLGKQLFTELESVITELTMQATMQSSTMRASRQGTRAKSAARDALYMTLKEISMTARVLAITQPNLETAFQLGAKVNDQVLLSAARAFLSDAQPLESQFISHDHAEGFLTELSEQIARFEQAVNEQERAISTRVTARAAIKRAVRHGMELTQKIDLVIENKFRREEVMLVTWRKARHIVHPQHRPLPAAPDPAPAPPEQMTG